MRLPLDEHLPIGLFAELHGHVVDTVSGRGWSRINNGELLSAVGGKPKFVNRGQSVDKGAESGHWSDNIE